MATAILSRLAQLNEASANVSNAMTMAVTLDACTLESDSLARFAAYSAVLWGAQALWWEGVGACAPVGSDDFALIAGINRRIAQWAEPLFLKAKDESVYLQIEGHVVDVVRYQITDVWSTSSLKLPSLQGVHARLPAQGDLIEAMDDELVAVHLANVSLVAPAGRTRALLFLSTALSTSRAGAPVRQLAIQMHPDVVSTRPIEPDRLQGFTDAPSDDAPHGISPTFFGELGCWLSWYGGGKMPLQLAGGSIQMVVYTRRTDDASNTVQSTVEQKLRQQIGRSPPKRATGLV